MAGWFVATAAAGALAAPAAADWLVTRDGAALETRGAWEVRGRLVVFTGIDGRLASLRLEDVDLEASRARTDAPEPAAEPVKAAPGPVEPVLVLTDADVAHVTPADAGSEVAGDETAAGEAAASAAPGATLAVTGWSDRLADGGLVISGELANRSEILATAIALTVRLLDREGSAFASAVARLGKRTLRAGEAIEFEALFPGHFSYRDVAFEPASFDVVPRAATAEPADDD